ncbi:MAG: restriction endonuclease [Patescibacteria group bacterium]|nr:restriction endonuclease [Patescibacteria group bacterium]
MRSFRIKKATHWHELFQPEKIFRSLERAGAGKELATAVLGRLENKLTRGTSTADIATRVSLELDRLDRRVAARYRLRRAIMELGPEGYPFEKYVGKIFSHYGYAVKISQHIPGRCISHEVDVDAQKDGRRLMIECKYHNRRGVQSDAKVALYTWARFEDIRDRGAVVHGGGTTFDEGWLVTNTKVTSDALAFSRCVGLKVLGWDEPQQRGLQWIIESANLYPITCLPGLNAWQRRSLLQHDLLLCHEVIAQSARLSQIGFSTAAAAQLVIAARQVVGAEAPANLPTL